MMLFIHGFGSCGWGQKSLLLRRHFGIERLIAPDLPFHPQQALEHLRQLIARYRIEALIGSSLGGFYATWLTGEYRLPSILINPVVHPHKLLSDYRGQQRRWCDEAPFAVGDDYLAVLRGLQRDRMGAQESYLVLLQQGDEVLDYREAKAFYQDKDLVVLPGGSHRFDHLERQLPRIDGWLQQGAQRDA